MINSRPAVLMLEDGRVFSGESYGAVGETFGEAVFNTGMTGYQETLTDPSYHRQIVVMTAPHIGNTGFNDADNESSRIWVAGYVVRDPASASNWRSDRELSTELVAQDIVGISGVDTRALTRHLRERGAMRAAISSIGTDPTELLNRVNSSPLMEGANLVGEVTTQKWYVVPAEGSTHYRVAALDLGIKRNTPQRMAARGIETHVLPAQSTMEEIISISPDAVFLSNGPGDPATATQAINLTKQLLARDIPVFGICFGNQILGRALGLDTYKLRYGHRGINQPVKDLATSKVEVTAHNHGFALRWPTDNSFSPIETEFGRVEVSHQCLNDNVIEGLHVTGKDGKPLAFSVQYHPEAAAGPHDADYLFDRFIDLIKTRKGI